MVISRDLQEVSVLECILGSLHMVVDVVGEPEQARARLATSKVDAVIVDYDLQGTKRLVRSLQEICLKQKAVPLVIASGSHGCPNMESAPAAFVFEKPISVEQAVHTLSAARNMILDARLRYHRKVMDVPVQLHCRARRKMKGHMLNLSQGGMGIKTSAPIQAIGPLAISFALPGTRKAVKAQGEIAWTDGDGRVGLKFLEMNATTKRNLQLWLERQYFLE